MSQNSSVQLPFYKFPYLKYHRSKHSAKYHKILISRFCDVVFCVPLPFRCRVCLSNLKHAPSRELLLTACKTVFSHLNPSIEATSKSCLLMLLVTVFPFLLRKSKNGGAIRRNILFMDPVWDSFFVLYENGTVSDRHESNSCRVSDRDEVRPVWVHF